MPRGGVSEGAHVCMHALCGGAATLLRVMKSSRCCPPFKGARKRLSWGKKQKVADGREKRVKGGEKRDFSEEQE